jgi:hypothetical protein
MLGSKNQQQTILEAMVFGEITVNATENNPVLGKTKTLTIKSSPE